MGLGSSSPEPPVPPRRPPPGSTSSSVPTTAAPRGTPSTQKQTKQEVPKVLFPPSAVQSLISSGRLAPTALIDGDGLCTSSNECPICFLNYRDLNLVSCCQQAICTNCYVNVRNSSVSVSSEKPVDSRANFFGGQSSSQSATEAVSTCPFCNKFGFKSTFAPRPPFSFSEDNRNSGTGTGSATDAARPTASPSPASASASVHTSPSMYPSSPSKDIFVPKSSIADRREMEQEIKRQHVQASSLERGERERERERERAGYFGAASGQLGRAPIGRERAGSGSAATRTPDMVRAQGVQRSGSAGRLLGIGARPEERAQDLDDLLMAAVLQESMKSEYAGTPDSGGGLHARPSARFGTGTDSSNNSHASGSSGSSEAEAGEDRDRDREDADDELLAALDDLDMTGLSEDERGQLALAIAMSMNDTPSLPKPPVGNR